MKNTPVTAGFIVIIAAQLALAIYLITLWAREKSKAKLPDLEDLCLTQSVRVSRRGYTCAGLPLPPIPLDAYRLCIVEQHRTIQIAYTSILLLYGASGYYPEPATIMVFISTDSCGDMYTPDFLAFSLIIFLTGKSGTSNIRGPTLLGTIAQDATWYFLVIFSSHFVLEMTLTLGRVSPTTSTTVNGIQRL